MTGTLRRRIDGPVVPVTPRNDGCTARLLFLLVTTEKSCQGGIVFF